MLALELYPPLWFGSYSLLSTIIKTGVSIVLGTCTSVENVIPHVNMCDGIDIILNKESLLSLKVVVAVVVIVAVAIFTGVLNIWFSSNVGITEMWTLITTLR